MTAVLATRVIDADQVRRVRDAMPEPEAIRDLAAVLGLLGDPTRLTLLIALHQAGEMCVADLAAATGSSESVASHALRLLRAHRVVAVRRAHRLAFYRLDDDHVRTLLETGLAHAGHGEPDAEHGEPDAGHGEPHAGHGDARSSEGLS